MNKNPKLPSGYEFHHIGYATTSIDKELAWFQALGYELESERFADPEQGITGCFLVGEGPRIELLENLPGAITLVPWLQAGIKIYHFAYIVSDLNAGISWVRANRGKLTVGPVPAVAFDGRNIIFAIFRNNFMIELIQK